MTTRSEFLLMNGNNGHYVRDIAGGQRVDTSRQSPIVDVDVSDDGALLFTAFKDGRVRVWRSSAKPITGLSDSFPAPKLEQVSIFNHGDKLGNYQLGETVNMFASPASPALFVSPNGRFIASQSQGLKTVGIGWVAGYDPMVRIWDVQKKGELRVSDLSVTCILRSRAREILR